MSTHRVFIEEDIQLNSSFCLNTNASNYLARVLRLKPGAEVILFNGQEPLGQYHAQITASSNRNVEVKAIRFETIENESPIQINLLQGISKGDRMDYTIQKSVELGVNAIYPIWMERTNVKLSDEKRLQKKLTHWQGVSNSALEQSGRVRQVEIHFPLKFNQIEPLNSECNIILDPYAQVSLQSLSDTKPNKINILIGPEGGLSDAEVEQAKAIGYTGIQLGPRILRTETASLAIISNLQYIWGDF